MWCISAENKHKNQSSLTENNYSDSKAGEATAYASSEKQAFFCKSVIHMKFNLSNILIDYKK